jgi:hypothetical protein
MMHVIHARLTADSTQHSLLDVLHDDNKQPLQPTINNNHTQGGIAAILIPRRSK